MTEPEIRDKSDQVSKKGHGAGNHKTFGATLGIESREIFYSRRAYRTPMFHPVRIPRVRRTAAVVRDLTAPSFSPMVWQVP
jgi:hypothetical protein